ncbi:MAG: hypothetical protein WCK16_01425 [Candidatus Moraniibacteriota bacterium]
MGFENPVEKSRNEKLKDIIKIATVVTGVGAGLFNGVVEAEAGGIIKVDEKVVGQKNSGVVDGRVDGSITPGIVNDAITPNRVDGALGKDNKITTTAEVKKSDEFSFDTPDNGGTGSFNGVSFKVAKKILKK